MAQGAWHWGFGVAWHWGFGVAWHWGFGVQVGFRWHLFAPRLLLDIRLPRKVSLNSHGARPVYENNLDDEVDLDQ
jgi:hypothetical protein